MTQLGAIEIISLGGTIAMTRSSSRSSGVEPTIPGAYLVSDVLAHLDSSTTVHVTQFRQLPGSSLTLEDIADLSVLVSSKLAAGAAGVVVTQGTDTIEETSFFLDLTHSGEQPVVFTGAMRNPTLAGADGPANLLAAIQVASSPRSQNLGCLVVMNDEVHSARNVRKSHSSSLAAFSSPETGPLGRVLEGELTLRSKAPDRTFIELPPHPKLPRVALYVTALGDDGRLLETFPDHVDGLVLIGLGGGHVHPSVVPHLQRLSASIPVVLTSRTSAGGVLARTYAYPGSEQDLYSSGLISGGALDPYKARILLTLALAAGMNRTHIKKTFEQFA